LSDNNNTFPWFDPDVTTQYPFGECWQEDKEEKKRVSTLRRDTVMK
jgi:hypothetical protein